MISFKTNQPEAEQIYTQRPGAYGILANDRKLLAIVKTSRGYFLPGGGIEGKESEEECLMRECIEEIGIKVKVNKKICSGDCYFYATTSNKYIESVGQFYECEVEEILSTKTEDDHELVWLDPNEAIQLLYLDNQKRAIKIFLENE